MTFDLYVWKSPRGLDDATAADLVRGWQEAGGDPTAGPFEPSDDVTWFYRELIRDEPELDVTTDATPIHGKLPVWLAGAVSDEKVPATHVAVIRLGQPEHEVLALIYGLAAKYDLIVFDPQHSRVHEPLAEMSEYASATFWPRGAIRAFVAGAIGLVLAIGAWTLAIPIVSIVVILVGGFLFVMAALTFVVEGRATLRRRRG